MSVALYEIANQYRDVLNWDISTEEDAEVLAELLGEIAESFDHKAEAVVAFARNVEAEAKAFKAEEDRIKAIRQALERKVEGLHKYLEIEMRRMGLTDIKAGLTKIKFVRNPWSVEISEGAEIPAKYLRIPAPIPDKAMIREALEHGETIEGVRLVQSERLSIR